jgi:hypothetical protein
LIKWKPGFSGKMFWTLEIPFKTGSTSSVEKSLVQETYDIQNTSCLSKACSNKPIMFKDSFEKLLSVETVSGSPNQILNFPVI